MPFAKSLAILLALVIPEVDGRGLSWLEFASLLGRRCLALADPVALPNRAGDTQDDAERCRPEPRVSQPARLDIQVFDSVTLSDAGQAIQGPI